MSSFYITKEIDIGHSPEMQLATGPVVAGYVYVFSGVMLVAGQSLKSQSPWSYLTQFDPLGRWDIPYSWERAGLRWEGSVDGQGYGIH